MRSVATVGRPVVTVPGQIAPPGRPLMFTESGLVFARPSQWQKPSVTRAVCVVPLSEPSCRAWREHKATSRSLLSTFEVIAI